MAPATRRNALAPYPLPSLRTAPSSPSSLSISLGDNPTQFVKRRLSPLKTAEEKKEADRLNHQQKRKDPFENARQNAGKRLRHWEDEMDFLQVRRIWCRWRLGAAKALKKDFKANSLNELGEWLDWRIQKAVAMVPVWREIGQAVVNRRIPEGMSLHGNAVQRWTRQWAKREELRLGPSWPLPQCEEDRNNRQEEDANAMRAWKAKMGNNRRVRRSGPKIIPLVPTSLVVPEGPIDPESDNTQRIVEHGFRVSEQPRPLEDPPSATLPPQSPGFSVIRTYTPPIDRNDFPTSDIRASALPSLSGSPLFNEEALTSFPSPNSTIRSSVSLPAVASTLPLPLQGLLLTKSPTPEPEPWPTPAPSPEMPVPIEITADVDEMDVDATPTPRSRKLYIDFIVNASDSVRTFYAV